MISKMRKHNYIGPGAAGLALAALVLVLFFNSGTKSAPAAAEQHAVMVDSALASKRDVPVNMTGLGTVQAYYTVAISTRVDGELIKVAFKEGQLVKAGDLLAQIDPRPYQAALDQAVAAKAKDVALLDNATIDLRRYTELAPEQFTSKQTLATQRALVDQTKAQILADDAAIDSAKTNLSYTTLRSPITGRTGIRQADPGNIVHSANSTPIVVVTEVQPISVLFTLPAEALQRVHQAMSGPSQLAVTALARDSQTVLDTGTLEVIDNLIDQTTGTMKLKAKFPNKSGTLWPGDFVNAKILVETLKGVIAIPTAGVQRGPDGPFAYVVGKDNTVQVRKLVLGAESDGLTVVQQGLAEGERVTTSNQYRLQPNVPVKLLNTDKVDKTAAGSKAP